MPQTTIIGGGLAGLSAATALAARGHTVTLLESRGKLGGRAGSFTEPETQTEYDACQHVGMGCCTELKRFWKTLGVSQFFQTQRQLYFLTPDRRQSVFRADPWPAPFHLGRALLSAHYLNFQDKKRIAYGLWQLMRESEHADPPLLPWLLQHQQTPRTLSRFWTVVLTSALNESLDNLGLKYARKVFRDGFLATQDGWVVEIPTVPLGVLYGEPLLNQFQRWNITVKFHHAVKHLSKSDTGFALHLRDGQTLTAERVVCALPFHRVLDILPDSWRTDPFFARIGKLTPSPITSVHVWVDRPVMDLPHAVVLDGVGHWVFNRGEVTPGEWYLQVVTSASRDLRALGKDEVQNRIVSELQRLFPVLRMATVRRVKTITEVAATFAAVPGVDAHRPTQKTPIPGFALAGDWTATGWPATMEGAVRSGTLAAQAVCG